MKNEKLMVNQKILQQRFANVSEQYFRESVVRPMGLGFWA